TTGSPERLQICQMEFSVRARTRSSGSRRSRKTAGRSSAVPTSPIQTVARRRVSASGAVSWLSASSRVRGLPPWATAGGGPPPTRSSARPRAGALSRASDHGEELRLVEHGDAEAPGVVRLGARLLPHHDVVRLLRDGASDASTQAQDGVLGLVAGEPLEPAREH